MTIPPQPEASHPLLHPAPRLCGDRGGPVGGHLYLDLGVVEGCAVDGLIIEAARVLDHDADLGVILGERPPRLTHNHPDVLDGRESAR